MIIFTPSSLGFYILFYFFMEYRVVFTCMANSSCCNDIYISSETKVAKNIHALDKDPGNKEAECLMVLLIP